MSIISKSAPPRRPIPVKELADHCARFHANNNALFNDEFKVRILHSPIRLIDKWKKSIKTFEFNAAIGKRFHKILFLSRFEKINHIYWGRLTTQQVISHRNYQCAKENWPKWIVDKAKSPVPRPSPCSIYVRLACQLWLFLSVQVQEKQYTETHNISSQNWNSILPIPNEPKTFPKERNSFYSGQNVFRLFSQDRQNERNTILFCSENRIAPKLRARTLSIPCIAIPELFQTNTPQVNSGKLVTLSDKLDGITITTINPKCDHS